MSETAPPGPSPAAEIDRDHEELFALLRESICVYRSGDAGSGLLAIGDLRARILSHFQTEERIMAATAYPGRAVHEEAHRLFTADLESLIAQAARGAPAAAVALWLEARVAGWFTMHLRGNDAALLKHLGAPADSKADAALAGYQTR